MSSNTSSSASNQCIVCGKKPCETRCSACLANGIDYIYFCSTEHQRLVWFLHKRVCGVNSSPFRTPAFSSEEVEEYKAMLNVPFPTAEGGTTTWIDMMKEFTRIPDRLRLQGVTEESHAITTLYELQADPKKPLFTRQQMNQLVGIRTIAYNARVGTRNLTTGEYHALIADHPFEWLSIVLGKRWARLDQNPLDDSRKGGWIDEVLHKYLIFIAIIARIHKKPESRSELIDLLKDFAVRFVLDFARLACTGTEEAFELTGYMISALLETCGLSSQVLGKEYENGTEFE